MKVARDRCYECLVMEMRGTAAQDIKQPIVTTSTDIDERLKNLATYFNGIVISNSKCHKR